MIIIIRLQNPNIPYLCIAEDGRFHEGGVPLCLLTHRDVKADNGVSNFLIRLEQFVIEPVQENSRKIEILGTFC